MIFGQKIPGIFVWIGVVKYAILDENDVVLNIAIADAPLAANWVDGSGAAIGDTRDGNHFVRPSTTLEQRLGDLAALRYENETAGITVGGTKVRTDRESQGMVNLAYNACQINPDRLINFKSVNGWLKLNSTEMTEIATAVADHVQACFTRESELAAALETNLDTDITSGWP